MKKIKQSDITDKDLDKLYEFRKLQIKNWVLTHPGKSLMDLQTSLSLPVVFMTDQTICIKCGHVEEKPIYAIVHSGVVFTCTCGNKFNV